MMMCNRKFLLWGYQNLAVWGWTPKLSPKYSQMNMSNWLPYSRGLTSNRSRSSNQSKKIGNLSSQSHMTQIRSNPSPNGWRLFMYLLQSIAQNIQMKLGSLWHMPKFKSCGDEAAISYDEKFRQWRQVSPRGCLWDRKNSVSWLIINNEIKLGRVGGSFFCPPPFSNLQVSPIGLGPKSLIPPWRIFSQWSHSPWTLYGAISNNRQCYFGHQGNWGWSTFSKTWLRKCLQAGTSSPWWLWTIRF